jgi:hypothetical protein
MMERIRSECYIHITVQPGTAMIVQSDGTLPGSLGGVLFRRTISSLHFRIADGSVAFLRQVVPIHYRHRQPHCCSSFDHHCGCIPFVGG